MDGKERKPTVVWHSLGLYGINHIKDRQQFNVFLGKTIVMREVPEWRGKSDDAPIPARVRLRIYLRHAGRCYCCGRSIRVGERWDCDHIIVLISGGEHRESNLAPILVEHH